MGWTQQHRRLWYHWILSWTKRCWPQQVAEGISNSFLCIYHLWHYNRHHITRTPREENILFKRMVMLGRIKGCAKSNSCHLELWRHDVTRICRIRKILTKFWIRTNFIITQLSIHTTKFVFDTILSVWKECVSHPNEIPWLEGHYLH